MVLDTILGITLNGLTFAMLYLLVASGLSLVFGLMDIVNFAHGSFYMLGAYIGLVVYQSTASFFVALLVAPLAVFAIAAALEVVTLRSIYDREPVVQLLLTFGLALVLDALVRVQWGANAKNFETPAMFAGQTSILGMIDFPVYRLTIIAIGILVAVAVWVFLNYTRYGLISRAGTMNRKMVEANGINIDRAFTLMFGVGGLLAGIAGVTAAPMFGAYPNMGQEMILVAFIVVVVGGLGTFRGSVAGAIVIGLAEAFGGYYIPELSQFLLFILLAGVLLIRPSGLMGRPGMGDH